MTLRRWKGTPTPRKAPIKGPAPLNPGSSAARAAGCTCSPVLNGYGRGQGSGRDNPMYMIANDCPRHRLDVTP
jgi:hypothetical protein